MAVSGRGRPDGLRQHRRPNPDSPGSLLERTFNSGDPIILQTGERRAFVADGGEVGLRGRSQAGGCWFDSGGGSAMVPPALPAQ